MLYRDGYNGAKEGDAVYTIQEVADIMKVHRNTISKWINSGQIEVVRIGRTVRVPEKSLQKLISTDA